MLEMNVGTLLDKAVENNQDAIAVKMGDTEVSYKQLREYSNRFANALLNLGLTKGDRLAIIMWNAIEYLYADYGSAKAGIVKVPMNHMLAKGDITFRLSHCNASAIVVDVHFLPWILELHPKFQNVKHIICITKNPKSLPHGVIDFNKLLTEASPENPDIEVKNNDILAIMYTGGTTGTPKGVVQTHKAYINIVHGEIAEWDIRENEIMFISAPLPHAAGFMVLPCLIVGGTVILSKEFKLQEFCHIVEHERATWTFMVPTMIYMLLEYKDRQNFDLTSLQTILYGAAPISPDRLKDAISEFGSIFIQAYSQMEVANLTTVFSKQAHLQAILNCPGRLKSCGRPCAISNVRIVNENNLDLPCGKVGEILTKGPHMMSGYWEDVNETNMTIREGWIYTGDLAWRDEEGYIYLVDRKKDMIISGGMNVYSADVESVIMQHPSISQAAIIGVPDAKWGEAVKAIIVLRPESDVQKEEIFDFCRDNLAAYKRPKSIDFVEQIPLTPYGKIDKKILRASYWKSQERAIH